MNRYLVCYETEGDIYKHIDVAMSIFSAMDMADCYDIHIRYIYLITDDCPRECIFRGVWTHDDPLQMDIIDAATGEVYDVGFGTDH